MGSARFLRPGMRYQALLRETVPSPVGISSGGCAFLGVVAASEKTPEDSRKSREIPPRLADEILLSVEDLQRRARQMRKEPTDIGSPWSKPAEYVNKSRLILELGDGLQLRGVSPDIHRLMDGEGEATDFEDPQLVFDAATSYIQQVLLERDFDVSDEEADWLNSLRDRALTRLEQARLAAVRNPEGIESSDEPVWTFNARPFERRLAEHLRELGYHAPGESEPDDTDRTEPRPWLES